MNEFTRDFKDISRGFGWVSLVLSVTTLGLVPFLLQLLEPYRTFAEMVVLTAPLTLSVAVLGLAWARGGFDEWTQGHVFLVPLAIILPYLISVWCGLATPMEHMPNLEGGRWLSYLSPVRLIELAVSVLSYYFTSYGLARTIASVTCGSFIVWVVDTKVLRR